MHNRNVSFYIVKAYTLKEKCKRISERTAQNFIIKELVKIRQEVELENNYESNIRV